MIANSQQATFIFQSKNLAYNFETRTGACNMKIRINVLLQQYLLSKMDIEVVQISYQQIDMFQVNE
jgi:hypothetical protein